MGNRTRQEELLVRFNSQDVMTTKTKIENWNKNDFFEEVEDEGQSTISTRWVVTNKVTLLKHDSLR